MKNIREVYGNVTDVLKYSVKSITLIGTLYFILVISGGTAKCVKRDLLKKTMYNVHMRSHEGLKYRCEYCGESFTRQMKLKYHMSEHTGNYRLKCDFCGKGFNSNTTV